MNVISAAEFQNDPGKILSFIEKGERIQIRSRNIPIAHIVPYKENNKKNKTRLGCGRGSVRINADPTEPMIPEENWEMLKNESFLGKHQFGNH